MLNRPCFTLNHSIYWPSIKDNDIEPSHSQKIRKSLRISRNSQLYKIVGYHPLKITDDEIDNLGFFKSLVFNQKNTLISYSPPKAMTYDSFKNKYIQKTNYLIAEEWVEGMMINVFWDESVGFHGIWEIATRDSLYGDDKMKNKKISECFKEACASCNLDVTMLDKKICYSFVMQHPEDIYVVVPFQEMRIYLIEMYEIYNGIDGTVCIYPFYKYEHALCEWLPKTNVKIPSLIEWKTDHFEELKNKYESINMPYFMKGVVIRDELSGLRTQIKNMNYSIAKNHYGKYLEKQYLFLKLQHGKKVESFLQHFSEYRSHFEVFKKEIEIIIQSLYNNYVTSFIKKEKKLLDFESKFMRNHLIQIHKLYKKIYKPENKYITLSIVSNYVNGLEPYSLMLFINQPIFESKKDWG